ncbi:hypothetical protein MIR68_000280 [Amoeboaphelidium protococcarum]|nr:hypothetical protein MIR68_000280 [Amoeboaphelidium protococcarum]
MVPHSCHIVALKEDAYPLRGNNNNNASTSSRYGRRVVDSEEIDLTQVSAADDPDSRTATLPKYSITPPPEHTTIVVQPPPYSPSQPEP